MSEKAGTVTVSTAEQIPEADQRPAGPSRKWQQAGCEPALAELLDDPIAGLLRRRDRLTRGDVARAVAQARHRLRTAETAAPQPANRNSTS